MTLCYGVIVVISVPATSANLGPGFDTLGLALKLHNTFSITPSKLSSIHISGEGEDRPKLRIDNVFIKIFNEILALHNYPIQPFKFSFHNAIPISRGLGSSSAVIVGAIVGAYHIMQKPINKSEILQLALSYENHPDNITPALYGGFNVSMLDSSLKTKEQVINVQALLPTDIKAVVVIPNVAISTKFSRRSLPKKYSTKDAVFNLSHACMLSAAFITHKWELLRVASQDRFHQELRMKNIPALFNVQKIALENGALLSTLSGSGSSFLNICYCDDSGNLAHILQKHFPKFRVIELEFDNIGATLIES